MSNPVQQKTTSDKNMGFEKTKIYLHTFGNTLGIAAAKIFKKGEAHKCFAKKPSDLYFNIFQIIFFGIWANVPLNQEGPIPKYIRENYSRISRWARRISTVVQFLLSVFMNDDCDWKLEHLLTFEPFWILIIYRICTFTGCKLYEQYHKRYCKRTSVEPEGIGMIIIKQ